MDGKLLVFSAPSGSGKTTLVHHLLTKFPNRLAFSVSATTRPPRAHERDKKDYYFLTPKEFKQNIADNKFVEWEEVYVGTYYGTLRSEIERLWKAGKCVVFDVDVKGGLKLKEAFGDKALAIFVKVSSEDEIKKRLMTRGTENDNTLETRLAKARYELSFEKEFDVVLPNDDLQAAQANAEDLAMKFCLSS